MRAGVSPSTVSRVLSDGGTVSTATRNRVWEAVRLLGYRPNPAARELVRGRKRPAAPTSEIGLVLSSNANKYSHAFFSHVLEGVDREASEQGLTLRFVLCSHELEAEAGFFGRITQGTIDGLLLVGKHPAHPVLVSRCRDLAIRVVTVEHEIPGVDAVSCDKRHGIGAAVDHLLHLGHRHLAFVGGVDERSLEFQHLAHHHGFRHTVIRTGWTAEAGYLQGTALLQRSAKPTAIAGGCDSIAVGVMRAAIDAGFRVPDDLSVTGFDDIDLARFVSPTLTTVAVNREDLGRAAVRRMLEIIRYEPLTPSRILLPTTFIARESTAPVHPARVEPALTPAAER